jgi:hypothetical protein
MERASPSAPLVCVREGPEPQPQACDECSPADWEADELDGSEEGAAADAGAEDVGGAAGLRNAPAQAGSGAAAELAATRQESRSGWELL